MNLYSKLVRGVASIGFFMTLSISINAQDSDEGPKDLLSGPGFENLDESFLQAGVVVREGEARRDIGSWACRTYKGEVKLTADKVEKVEGQQSLKMEVISEAPTRFVIMQDNRKVKPNTIYEMRMFVKPYNIDWIMSLTRFDRYPKDSNEIVESDDRRMVNYSTSSEFKEEARRIVTGPKAEKMSLYLMWQLQKRKGCLIEEKSMLWLDDMKLVEIGPAYPVSGEYLSEDFEKDLSNWIMADPGDGDENNPKISDENAHKGKQSLKLTGTWGSVERVFGQEISDCAVTIWFYDKVDAKGVRMIMLANADGKRAGLGAHTKFLSNYTYYVDGDPRIEEAANIKRTTGWHEFKWDYRQGGGITFYIDGQEVGKTDRIDTFRAVRLGENSWSGFTCYVDDLRIEKKGDQFLKEKQ